MVIHTFQAPMITYEELTSPNGKAKFLEKYKAYAKRCQTAAQTSGAREVKKASLKDCIPPGIITSIILTGGFGMEVKEESQVTDALVESYLALAPLR